MKSSKQAKREARQLFQSCLVNGLLDENRARQAPSALLTAGHRKGPAILAHFLRLVRLDRERHTANIESATSLPPDSASQVRARLLEVYGPGLNVSFAQNPALIGGIRVIVGSDVYDGSVRGRLAALQRSFS